MEQGDPTFGDLIHSCMEYVVMLSQFPLGLIIRNTSPFFVCTEISRVPDMCRSFRDDRFHTQRELFSHKILGLFIADKKKHNNQ